MSLSEIPLKVTARSSAVSVSLLSSLLSVAVLPSTPGADQCLSVSLWTNLSPGLMGIHYCRLYLAFSICHIVGATPALSAGAELARCV